MTRRLARARCSVFGHDWTRWTAWWPDGFGGLAHDRLCMRCGAVEVQGDGADGEVIHG